MSSVEITRVKDVREGDVVTLAYQDHEFTGEAWYDPDNEGLNVGPIAMRWYGLQGNHVARFVRATREVPDLPTEPGSVIVNATIRGKQGQTAVLASTRFSNGVEWISVATVSGSHWHLPEEITAWTPAKIVADGEQVTR